MGKGGDKVETSSRTNPSSSPRYGLLAQKMSETVGRFWQQWHFRAVWGLVTKAGGTETQWWSKSGLCSWNPLPFLFQQKVLSQKNMFSEKNIREEDFFFSTQFDILKRKKGSIFARDPAKNSVRGHKSGTAERLQKHSAMFTNGGAQHYLSTNFHERGSQPCSGFFDGNILVINRNWNRRQFESVI